MLATDKEINYILFNDVFHSAEMFNSYSSARSREVRAHVGRRGGDKEPERIIISHHC